MVASMDTLDKDGNNIAACAQPDINPDFFFDPFFTDWAQSVCHRCPLREQCAEFALTEKIKEGVWGGLSEQERVTLLRRKSRQITGKASK
jgi:WhiB family transcriptional regulator, redox-sensing transcriptional regulator